MNPQLKAALEQRGLDALVGKLESLIRPSVRLRPTGGSAPCGTSKLGGYPDVTRDFIWPVSSQDWPLAFVCQINVKDIQTICNVPELPPEGMLYAFYDAANDGRVDENSYRIMFEADPSGLFNMHAPHNTPDANAFFESALMPKLEETLPWPDAPQMDGMLAAEQRGPYLLALDQTYGGRPCHRLLGWGQGLSGSPEKSLGSAARLLLQIDTEPDCGIQWPRDGRMFFCMPSIQPLAKAFVQSKVVLQASR